MGVTIYHYENGNIKRIEVRNDAGELHNPSGPAYQKWYKNGQEKYRAYWIDGERHNPSGPAYQKWYENGQEEYRQYVIEGKAHNPSGPSWQEWYENGQEKCRMYWIDGKKLSKEEFEARRDTVEIQVEGKMMNEKLKQAIGLEAVERDIRKWEKIIERVLFSNIQK